MKFPPFQGTKPVRDETRRRRVGVHVKHPREPAGMNFA